MNEREAVSVAAVFVDRPASVRPLNHRVWPLAIIVFAAALTIGWTLFLGYLVLKVIETIV